MHLNELLIKLKERRKVLGITQEHLADLSGTGLRTIKSLENGNTNPTLETLNKIADVLGMEIKLEVKKPEL